LWNTVGITAMPTAHSSSTSMYDTMKSRSGGM